MMSIGQATAQSLQAMQRSKEKRNIPRKRSCGSRRSSGYRMVTFGFQNSRNVVLIPSSMSRRRKRSLHLDFGYSTCMGHSRRPARLRPPGQIEQGHADDGNSKQSHDQLAQGRIPRPAGQNQDSSHHDVAKG